MTTFLRQERPWDSMERLRRAVETLNAAPLPQADVIVPRGPDADHPFFAEVRAGGLRPQLVRALVDEFPDIAYIAPEQGLMLTGSAGRPAYVVTAPEYVDSLLSKQGRDLHRARAMVMLQVLAGEGMLTSEGEVHARQRRMAQPAFATPRFQGYVDEIVRCTEAMLAAWHPDETVDVETEMNTLTMVVGARLLMGSDVSGYAEEFSLLQRSFMAEVLPALVMPGGVEAAFTEGTEVHAKLRSTERLDGVVQQLIDEHRASGDSGDLLSALIGARDEGAAMDDAQLRDEIFTLLFAGNETTGRNLTWAWMLLAEHPEILARVQNEARAALASGPITLDSFERLPLTRAVALEALRLFPPVWNLPRLATVDVEVGPWTIPAGAAALVPVWAIQRDGRWWDRPDQFVPERWLDAEGRVDEKAPGQPDGAWLPFGLGNRHCIAKRLAPIEVALIVALVARDWTMELPDGTAPSAVGSLAVRPEPPTLRLQRS